MNNSGFFPFGFPVDDLLCLPCAVCCALWPLSFGHMISKHGNSPSFALSEIRTDSFQRSVNYRFKDYSSYLEWLLAVIGDDLPDFTAAFLDELHKQERPSSSLRL